jgi:hypothetical protein
MGWRHRTRSGAANQRSSGDEMERHRLLGELITYVDANREGIHNYVRYGAQGSGAIEKTMDVAVGRRLKAKGTSWFRPGAHRLLSLPPRSSGRLMPESGMHPSPRWGIDRPPGRVHDPRKRNRALC